MTAWYRFQNVASDPSTVDIHIIDAIGGWIDDMLDRMFDQRTSVTARAFVEDLAQLPESVTALRVHINSPGGDVMAGVNIANALREQASKGRRVDTYVDGIAASIASVIAMAGQQVHIADNALLMVHNPWSFAIGDAAAMRKEAEVLDTIREQIVATYQWHVATLSADEIKTLMDDETWMTADEAIAYGFATAKVEGLQAAASITRGSVRALKVPAEHRARVEAFLQPPPAPAPAAPPPASAEALLPLAQAAGCSTAFVAELVAAKLPLDQAQQRIADDQAARAAAATRAAQIRAVCAQAKVPQLADGYIAGGMELDGVRAHLVTVTALVDGKLATDGGLLPEGGPDVGASWKAAFDTSRRGGRKH